MNSSNFFGSGFDSENVTKTYFSTNFLAIFLKKSISVA